jgi:hypothetical protein
MPERAAIAKLGTDKYNAMALSNVRWDADRVLWVSQTSQKVFSDEWVQGHTVGQIREASGERLKDGEFRVHSNEVFDTARIRELADRYGWTIF